MTALNRRPAGNVGLAAGDFFRARNRAVLRLLACLDLLRAVGICKMEYRVAVQSCTAPGVGATLPGVLAVNDRDLAYLPHHRGMEAEIRRLFAEMLPLPPAVAKAENALLRTGLTDGFARACQAVLNRPFQLSLFADIRDRRLDRPSLADAFANDWLSPFHSAAEAAMRQAPADAREVLQLYSRLVGELAAAGNADAYVHAELDLVEGPYTLWAQRKILYVFDFDDTIAFNKHQIGFRNDAGQMEWVNTARWKELSTRYGQERFDFTALKTLVDPVENPNITRILKRVYATRGAAGVAVCTARSPEAQQSLVDYLAKQLAVTGVHVQCTNLGDKGEWIASQIDREGYTRICFFDDSVRFLDQVRAIRPRYPFVEILVHRAQGPH